MRQMTGNDSLKGPIKDGLAWKIFKLQSNILNVGNVNYSRFTEGNHRQQRLKGDIECQKPSPGSSSKAYSFAINPLMHNVPKWSDTL